MRTTVADVKSVIDTALEDEEIQRLMQLANRMVTNLLDGELDEEILKDIETWMTAHLIAIGKERQIYSEKVDDIWVQYQGKFGESLKSTTFGQMVLFLDTSGKLESSTKRKAIIRAIPQNPENYE